MLKESLLYDNLWVDDKGTTVYNSKLKRYYELYISNSGYLYAGGVPVHRIVASAYKFEQYFEHATVDHIDGNKMNNSVDNLEWVTQSENAKRSYKNGRMGAWSNPEKIYPKTARIKQAEKMKGANNPAAKKRMIVCDDGEKIICDTRNDVITKIEKKYGKRYSISYIKYLIKTKRDNKLGFDIIECQSTIENISE